MYNECNECEKKPSRIVFREYLIINYFYRLIRFL